MSRCNSYNEENNNDFDNKQIVIKNDAKIIIKNYVEIVKNVGECSGKCNGKCSE